MSVTRVRCPRCGATYDALERWTFCPHAALTDLSALDPGTQAYLDAWEQVRKQKTLAGQLEELDRAGREFAQELRAALVDITVDVGTLAAGFVKWLSRLGETTKRPQ